MSARVKPSERAKQKRAFGLARAVGLAAFSLLGVLGCASIIGLDDYTVAGHGGSASDAGSAGKAGSTSNAGEAGVNSGGDAGSNEAGGRSGAGNPNGGSNPGGGDNPGGDAGEAGSGPMLPPIVGCDGVTAFEPSENLVRSCILRAGCNPNPDPVRNISTCVTYDTQAALPGESCNLTSKTCEDYEACEHIGVAHDDLCGGTKKTRCENNLAINCDNYGTDQFYDCTALGGTCGTYNYSDDDHTLYSDCKLDITPESCLGSTSDDTLLYCHSAAGQEDLRYYCWEDQAWGSSCGNLATCSGDPAAGDASCYFNLPSCAGSAVTCKGDVANVCSGGDLFKYDCGAAGLSCSVNAGTEYCLAPGCKPADIDSKCTESCSADGSQLTFCYGGAPYTVTCTDYGFTQCLHDTDDDGNPYASCRF